MNSKQACRRKKMLIRVFFSCCDSIASPQATVLCADEAGNICTVLLLICRVLFSCFAAASRGRRQHGHRPGRHDPVRATKATSNKSASSKVHRRECYLASVHMELVNSPTCTRTEGRVPVWGSDFTTKVASKGIQKNRCWAKKKFRASD